MRNTFEETKIGMSILGIVGRKNDWAEKSPPVRQDHPRSSTVQADLRLLLGYCYFTGRIPCSRVQGTVNSHEHFHNSYFVIPIKNRKTGILFTISYIKNVAINEINAINKNFIATPIGNFKTKKPATTRIGICRM